MQNVAFITGASSGIGLEFAKIHAARKGDMVLVARRKEKLEEIRRALEEAHGVAVRVIAKDLSVPGAGEAVYQEVASLGIAVQYLINNAGFGGHGLFHERDWAKDKAMIHLNVLALTELTRLFLPHMLHRESGSILNVASTAGFVPGPLQAVYYATKAYVVSFSEAIANELKGTGVTVTALCPGATATEFAKTGDLEDASLFKMGGMVASAEDVAAYGYTAMLKGKTVAIPGFANNLLIRVLTPLMPRSLVTAVSRSMMEK